MVMTPEAWTVVGTGVVILIAIAASNRQLRSEMKTLRDEHRDDMKALRDEHRDDMKALREDLCGDMKALREDLCGETTRIRTEVTGLRERMARLEGLLEGLREAITDRRAA